MSAAGAPATQPLDTVVLLKGRDLSAPLAWHRGRSINGHRLLFDAHALAAQLPLQGRAINLCGDRYAFVVALLAAALADQPSLLPPDARADTLTRLAGDDAGAYAIIDAGELQTPGLQRFFSTTAQESANAPAASSGSAQGAGLPCLDADRVAAVLMTSGSTGLPQAHAKRWGTLARNVAAASARLADLMGFPSLAGVTLISTVPAQHSYGFESTVLLALLGGAAFDSGRAFYPADVAAALDAVPRPRALVTTPFHLKTLLAAGIALPTVDLLLSATAPLSPQLAGEAEAALGGNLVEIYGATETGQLATRRPVLGDVWHTFGAVRVSAAHNPPEGDRERDGDGGEAQPQSFIAQGDYVAEPTPLADVLELVDASHFRLLGRSNDLIHVAGRRSSLAHLNFHLNSIAGVRDGAFWMPDDVSDGIVRPVALVVAEDLSAAHIVRALRERLEPVFVPRTILHVDRLPREDTGKLTEKTLRQFALAALAKHAPTPMRTPAQEAIAKSASSAGVPAPTAVPHSLATHPAARARHISGDHPAFAGHFPGQPLLPGAYLLAEVLQALCADAALAAHVGALPQLAHAKFLLPVRPGSDIRIVFEPAPTADAVSFALFADDAAAVTGRWVRALAGPP